MELSKAVSFNPQTSCLEFVDIDSIKTETSEDETFNTQVEFGSESDIDDVKGADDVILAQIKSDPGNDNELEGMKSLHDDELQTVLENSLIVDIYQHFCSLCDFQAKKSYKVKLHKEVKHEGIKHSCNQCDFTATYKDGLKTHIKAVHEGIKHSCNQCGFQSSYLNSLRSHQ